MLTVNMPMTLRWLYCETEIFSYHRDLSTSLKFQRIFNPGWFMLSFVDFITKKVYYEDVHQLLLRRDSNLSLWLGLFLSASFLFANIIDLLTNAWSSDWIVNRPNANIQLIWRHATDLEWNFLCALLTVVFKIIAITDSRQCSICQSRPLTLPPSQTLP